MVNHTCIWLCRLLIILAQFIQLIKANEEMHIFFLRHIESINNAKGIRNFGIDSPASVRGRKQLQNLYEKFGETVLSNPKYEALFEPGKFHFEGMSTIFMSTYHASSANAYIIFLSFQHQI